MPIESRLQSCGMNNPMLKVALLCWQEIKFMLTLSDQIMHHSVPCNLLSHQNDGDFYNMCCFSTSYILTSTHKKSTGVTDININGGILFKCQYNVRVCQHEQYQDPEREENNTLFL